MRVRVDADVCQGHGVCCALCPDVFELSDDGYAEVVLPDVPEHLEADVRAAVGQCPARAISVDWRSPEPAAEWIVPRTVAEVWAHTSILRVRRSHFGMKRASAAALADGAA